MLNFIMEIWAMLVMMTTGACAPEIKAKDIENWECWRQDTIQVDGIALHEDEPEYLTKVAKTIVKLDDNDMIEIHTYGWVSVSDIIDLEPDYDIDYLAVNLKNGEIYAVMSTGYYNITKLNAFGGYLDPFGMEAISIGHCLGLE